MLRVDSHAWSASSAGAYWNTTEKMDEKVKRVNYDMWLSLIGSRSFQFLWASQVYSAVRRPYFQLPIKYGGNPFLFDISSWLGYSHLHGRLG